MLNHIVIMGRLTRDPELRKTQGGTSVASFTLAVDRDFTPEGGEKETDFIDYVAWKGTADFVSGYFFKGSMAVVDGRLQLRDWKDKDGNKRRSAEVVANRVYFGEGKKSSEPKDGKPRRVYDDGRRRRRRTAVLRRWRDGKQQRPCRLVLHVGFPIRLCLDGYAGAWAVYHAPVPSKRARAHDDAGNHTGCQKAVRRGYE